MDAERWQRMFELFDRVVELPPGERASVLDGECGEDRGLRRSVEELLEGHSLPGGLLEHSATVALEEVSSAAPSDGRLEAPSLPDRFGSYRVVRRLGEGGFGTVYLAERLDGEFEQQVAIKVLRPGHDSREVLRRFHQERQILARLEHPNIARLLDGGTAEDGRPYVVLERVEGIPIDRFCQERGLGVDGRLALFLRVCDAVQYAHQSLVVHRDLKPGNILVAAGGTPKLLDFGIAKLLGDEAGARTVTGLRAFTPRYASPEQVRGEAITTASDVYSLGVVLYELLTGSSPYRVDSGQPHELARAVVEEEPPPPSVVVDRRASSGSGLEAARRSSGLRRRLRGDLDTITLKALDKEPGRRYGSVQELANDIERHRAGLPVRARPDTVVYRTRKFVRRHRLAVAASIVVLTLAAGWIATLSVQFARTERALARAERITELLIGVFSVADPESTAEEVTASQLLAAGEERVREELADDPEVRAALLGVIGEIDAHLGLRSHAEELQREALGLQLDLNGEVHPDVAESRLRLGGTLFHLGRYEESEEQLRAALAVRRRLFGADDAEQAEILRTLGWIAHDRGELDRAEELYREGLELRRRELGPDHPKTARSEYDVGSLLLDRGKLEEAEGALRHAATILEHDERDRASWLGVQGQLGWLLLRKGELAEAEAVLRVVYDEQRRRLGAEHTSVATAATRLASALRRLDRLAEAEELSREALRIYRTRLGPDHSYTATAMVNLGLILQGKGDLEEAAEVLGDALTTVERTLDPDHPLLADTLHGLGGVLAELGRGEEAEQLLRRALELDRRTLGGQHPKTLSSLHQLGFAVFIQGRPDEARELLEEALEQRRRSLPAGHPDIAASLSLLGELETQEGSLELGESQLREALAIYVAALPRGHLSWAEVAALLGANLTRQGRFDEAKALLDESVRILLVERGTESREAKKAVRFREELQRAVDGESAAGVSG